MNTITNVCVNLGVTDVYKAHKLVTQKSQLYVRELAVIVIKLYKETLAFKEQGENYCKVLCQP